MNKQNTHKKLPLVSPGLVTNLPQVSLSFSRGREEKKGPRNEVQSSLDWVEQYDNENYLLNTMFFLLFCKFIFFSCKPCELTLLQHVYEENISNEFHDKTQKWLKGWYTVYTKRLRVILSPIESSPLFVTICPAICRYLSRYLSTKWVVVTISLIVLLQRQRAIRASCFLAIFTHTYSLLWYMCYTEGNCWIFAKSAFTGRISGRTWLTAVATAVTLMFK